MNYIVYKTTNLLNGKYYIGVHRTNPDIFDGYIGCGVTKKDSKKRDQGGLPAAVRKHGYENFKRETLYIYPDTEDGRIEAYAKEAEIVTEEFIADKLTYNRCIGGLNPMGDKLKKEIAQYDLSGSFIKVWPSITDAEIELGLTSIGAAVSGASKYAGEYQWREYDGDDSNINPVETKERKVYQFDLQGNLLKVWRSATEASESFTNKSAARSSIAQGCQNGGQRMGYYWSFKCKFDYEPPKHFAAVAKYNDSGEFIESYQTITEAARVNNILSSNISHCIKGRSKRCGGFRWRYFYGNTSNIKPIR